MLQIALFLQPQAVQDNVIPPQKFQVAVQRPDAGIDGLGLVVLQKIDLVQAETVLGQLLLQGEKLPYPIEID